MPERITLRIGDMGKEVLVSGQAYQDPKDALNEFVSNAADEYAEAGARGERVRIVLRRRGRYPVIAVEDSGRGMDADRLREVARNLFQSSKAADPRTIGEKAIGVLAIQQIGGRCDIVTRPEGSAETLALRLERGSARAELELNERRRARDAAGTTIYLSDLDPDVLRVLTLRKVVDYLRRRRGHALARGDYQTEVIEGKHTELVTPEEPDGVRLDVPARSTLWGADGVPSVHRCSARSSPSGCGRRRRRHHDPRRPRRHRGVRACAMVERPGIGPHRLRGTPAVGGAGRGAVLRDRDAFPVFVDALRSVEPAVARMLERIAREVDVDVAGRLNEAVRRIFGRVLKELDDLDNPMRTSIGTSPARAPCSGAQKEASRQAGVLPFQRLHRVPRATNLPRSTILSLPRSPTTRSRPNHRPRPSPSTDGPRAYVVYNNPRAASDELAEEMVRMLVRVRRHLPRKA